MGGLAAPGGRSTKQPLLALTPCAAAILLSSITSSVLEKLPGESPAGPHGGAIAANGDVYLGLLSGKVEKFIRE